MDGWMDGGREGGIYREMVGGRGREGERIAGEEIVYVLMYLVIAPV